MMVQVISANGPVHKPDRVPRAPADTGVRPCVCDLSTKGKAQNVTLFNFGNSIGGMPANAVLPLNAPSGTDSPSSSKWPLEDRFAAFECRQAQRSIVCAVGNACPLMSIKFNALAYCREDPIHRTAIVYRIGFSRSGTSVPACPPASQPD